MTLVKLLFAIQAQIIEAMPEEYTLVDSGMFLPTGGETVHWRDATVECPELEREYSFTYSTDGELKGEVPPRMVMDVNMILNQYKK